MRATNEEPVGEDLSYIYSGLNMVNLAQFHFQVLCSQNTAKVTYLKTVYQVDVIYNEQTVSL